VETPPNGKGVCGTHTPDSPQPQLASQINCDIGFAQACGTNVDPVPLVCGAQRGCDHSNTQPQTRARESHEIQLLRLILSKLAEIQATIASPLVKRQLWPRFCVSCGVLVTNKNVGGFTGRSALTGKLFCSACADDVQGGAS
jgi:hypothetical protein